jgi:hypothetical protein
MGGRQECRTLLCGLCAVCGNTFRQVPRHTHNIFSLIVDMHTFQVEQFDNCSALSLKQCAEPPESKLQSTSPVFPESVAFATKIIENEKNSLQIIHSNLSNGRQSAEDMLNDKEDGYYLVRPSSPPESCALSLKMENTVKHFLVKSVMTEEGQQWTLNTKHFRTLETLLAKYHQEDICGPYKLVNIILPQHTDDTCQSVKEIVTPFRSEFNPVYIEKFCELIESHKNKSLEQDIAERLGYGQLFKNYKCGFEGKDSSRSQDARWILEKWIVREGERASVENLEKNLNIIKDMQNMLKKLKAFSKPW